MGVQADCLHEQLLSLEKRDFVGYFAVAFPILVMCTENAVFVSVTQNNEP